MNDFTQIADAYIAMWNETDQETRRKRVEALWAAGGRYVDPLVDVEGHDGIAQVVATVQQQFPGMQFRRAGDVDAHHDQARFGWELGIEGEEPLVVGFDVAQRDADGRLALVLGFLDKVPG